MEEELDKVLSRVEEQHEGQARRRLVAGTVQTPSVLGLGLLESVYEDELLAREDPGDLDRDGIRGVANRVQVGNATRIGRFGWQAQLPTVRDFVRAACGGELGLTVPQSARSTTREPNSAAILADRSPERSSAPNNR